MLIRSAILASLALGGISARIARNIDPAKYRLESKTQTTIDLSAFGQGAQEQVLGMTAWIGLTFSDTTGGRIVHIVVDSAKVDGTAPIGPESLDSVKGGAIHGFLDATGHVKNLTSTPNASLLMGAVQGVVTSVMFPRARAGMKAGDVWTDTSETTNTTNGSNLKTKASVNYTVGAAESVVGQNGTRLTADLSLTVSGTLESPMAGTMETTGSGTGQGSFVIGSAGQVLSGTTNSTINQNLKTAMAPAPIPVKVAQSITVTLLK
jgi:hypothetical protein